MGCAFCDGSIFEPSPFYRELVFEFEEIEAIEGYNRNLGIATAVKLKSCDHIFHTLCFFALHKELTQRKPLLRGEHLSCFATGCFATFQYWSELRVYPLDHLMELEEGLVILSNQAVLLMKKYTGKKDVGKKSRVGERLRGYVGMKPLEYYFHQPSSSSSSSKGDGLYESGVLHPETQDVKKDLLEKVKVKREQDDLGGKALRSKGKPSHPVPPAAPPSSPLLKSPEYEAITPATSDVDDDSEVVYVGERHVTPVKNNVTPKRVPPLMVKRPRGKQIVFVEASSSEDEDSSEYDSGIEEDYDSVSYHSESEAGESDLDSLCGLPFSKKRKSEDLCKGGTVSIPCATSSEEDSKAKHDNDVAASTVNNVTEVHIAQATKRANDDADNEDAKKMKMDEQATSQVDDIADICQSVFGHYSTIEPTTSDYNFDFYQILGLDPPANLAVPQVTNEAEATQPTRELGSLTEEDIRMLDAFAGHMPDSSQRKM